ncbi:MAG: SDR family oxidoreductase [Thermodesulfobacteriota bacterium]
MKRFEKKRAFITGAGSGLGRALALQFAAKGWKVAIGEINAQRAEESKRLVEEKGGKGLVVICDVTDEKALQAAAETLSREWGGVDVLINNAGVAAAGSIEKIPMDQWEWILNINLKSVILGCKVFVPMMEAQGGGHIVNVASSAGIACLPEMSCYNVTKAAVISLSETLYTELWPKKIGVTVVAPTFFKTNLMDQFRSTDESQREMAQKFFARSLATAEQVAAHVVKSIEKKRLYAIYQPDGKLVWWAKRLAPQMYYRTVGFFYSSRFARKAASAL